jgi:4-amino-4-deoxychorismate lyase
MYHNARFNLTRRELFGINQIVSLENIIQIPPEISGGVYKVRVLYSEEIKRTEFAPYTPKEIKSIKLIEDMEISYAYKYAERNKLISLSGSSDSDDIIITKNGFLTDASFANLVFYDGAGWHTPETYLLNGVMRQKLLNDGIIKSRAIHKKDIPSYSHFKLINAMLGFHNSPLLPVKIISE